MSEHIDYEAEQNKRVWWLNNTGGTAQDNLTVRDYFAAQALQGLLTRSKGKDEVSELAYLYANAMMKERAK